ncbi:hemagglutinin [Mycoplasmopsis synoviae]|uniref:hemagglutinin n=1 Tax=Mycoplasmopsis synoviae TaxID=2109 RepID=UPI000E3C148F|nr:hemagglutinin [Mycoplasmopsis synoviae]
MLIKFWDGFMPKIVVQGYEADGEEKGKATHKEANQKKLEDWFAANQDKLSLVADQLTRKLGKDKFKNMVLSTPTITWDEVEFSNKGSNKVYLTPKVTFNLAAKDGYALAEGSTTTVTLTIRVLYKDSNLTRNVLSTQGAYYTAAPKNAIVDDANVKAKVNVYMNYTGPNIELDADLPTVGGKENTSINGTSNVEGTFNDKFKKLLVNVVGESITQTSLLQAIINYVNKFDPKFPAEFVLKTNGVTVASVQNNTQLRIGSLNDFLYNNKGFLQQVNTDTKAVYFAVMGVTSNGWVNTFLIRIPLTKFVRPISVLEEQTTEEETQESQEGQENQEQGSTTQTNTESSGTGQSSDLTEVSA